LFTSYQVLYSIQLVHGVFFAASCGGTEQSSIKFMQKSKLHYSLAIAY
jgi:hypothetical protein